MEHESSDPATADETMAEPERDVGNPVPPESGTVRYPQKRRAYFDFFKQLVTRPENMQNKRGVTGTKISLQTNYITVNVDNHDKIFLYRVDFTPSYIYGTRKWKALRKFTEDPCVGLDINKDCVFDGENLLYCKPSGFEKLGDEKVVENCRITRQPRPKEDSVDEAVSFEEVVTVRVSRVADIPPDDPRILAQLNTHLHRFCETNLKMARDGDGFYDPGAAVKPQNVSNFEIWPGFGTSIGVYDTLPGDSPLLMNVDPKFRIVRTDTALQVMLEARATAQKLHPLNTAVVNEAVLKSIRGLIVTTKYNNVSYRVEDVLFDESPASLMGKREKSASSESKKIPVGRYTEEKYGVRIMDREQPLLLAKHPDKAVRRERGAIWLIPELCLMTGYTDQMKNDFRIMKEVAKTTKMNPDVRKDKVLGFVHRLAENSEVQEELSEWGTLYGRFLCTVPARLLPPQTIIQRGQTASYQSANADWTRDIRSRPSDVAPEVVKNMWMMLHCNEEARALGFAKTLAQVSAPLGLNLSAVPGKFLNVGSDNGAAFVAAATKNWNAEYKLIVAVFPSNAADRYSTFKNNFCCIAPCPTQVVLAKTIEPGKNLMSVATKVALQLVAKLGGRNWKMDFPFNVPTMVIGIDTHCDRVNKEIVVAVAGTHDTSFSDYHSFSRAVPQARRKQEQADAVSDAVRELVQSCVREYNEHNKCFPQQVFIYRDGTSEGEQTHIMEKELKGILEVLKGAPATPPIKTSYILVHKRNSTRFFDNNGNPKAGTVVDSIVTRPYRFDFFLVSQSVREGTVAPTYYDVIHHECDLLPNSMQIMTYMLCHMYFNWTGTIRVPAPCQYARKHAQLVANNLHSPAATTLRNKLFFL